MVVTNFELTNVKSLLMSDLITDFAYGAVGTATTTPTVGDTQLGEERLRQARQEYTQLTNDLIVSMYINAGQLNGTAIRESGWFAAASSGTVLQRALITSIAKTSDIEVWIDTRIKLNVTQG